MFESLLNNFLSWKRAPKMMTSIGTIPPIKSENSRLMMTWREYCHQVPFFFPLFLFSLHLSQLFLLLLWNTAKAHDVTSQKGRLFGVFVHTSSLLIGCPARLISSLPPLSHSAVEPELGRRQVCRLRFLRALIWFALAACVCERLVGEREKIEKKNKTQGGPPVCVFFVSVPARDFCGLFASQRAALIL